MPRPRRDGLPPRLTVKRKITESYLNSVQPERRPYLIWDVKVSGLAVAVHPTGRKVWKCIYPFHGRNRWYTIGKTNAIPLGEARKLAAAVLLKVATDIDPQAERKASRGGGTFDEISERYINEFAKHHNKSWKQADALVRRNLLPRWAKLRAAHISRSDVKAAISRISSPSVANQTLAAASAIFSWAIKEEVGGIAKNPCAKVTQHKTQSRDRVLSEAEIPKFWQAFDEEGLVVATALKVVLLTGQRPGEVRHMRREHIVDGWWKMPGAPAREVGWPGTKNGERHSVWLPAVVLDLISELDGAAKTGFVFGAKKLDEAMRCVCARLEVVRATPHDLRRTHGTMIIDLGFGRDAMNRIENHKESSVGDVYDRHDYAPENKKVMEAVAARIIALVNGSEHQNVILAKFQR